MSQDAIAQPAAANQSEIDDRRNHRRHAGKAIVHVIRERDPGRTRVPAKLMDISIAGIGLVTAVRIEVKDQVRVALQNEIHLHLEGSSRHTVRWMAPTAEGEFRLGIELSPRLSANELLALTRVGTNFGTGTGKVWM